MPYQFEVGIFGKRKHVPFAAREKVVDTKYITAALKQSLNQMTADKAGSACNENILHRDVPRSLNARVTVSVRRLFMSTEEPACEESVRNFKCVCFGRSVIPEEGAICPTVRGI